MQQYKSRLRPKKTKKPSSDDSPREKTDLFKRIKLTQSSKVNQLDTEKTRGTRSEKPVGNPKQEMAMSLKKINLKESLFNEASSSAPLHLKNHKLQEIIDYWSQSKSNQSILYDIVKENHKLRPMLGDFYIGPQNFVILKNLLNQPTLEFQIADYHFNFKLPTLIIPGIPENEVKIGIECEKTEISATEFIYDPSDVYFLPYDIHKHLSFQKNPYIEPLLCEMTTLSKTTAKKLLESFKRSEDSTPNLDIIQIENDQEIETLFTIICKEKLSFVTCFHNDKMRNIDIQQIANLVISYEALEKPGQDPPIFNIFQSENNPTNDMFCYFENGEILFQLIKRLKQNKYSVKFAETSMLCKFILGFFNFAIIIIVKTGNSGVLKGVNALTSENSEEESKFAGENMASKPFDEFFNQVKNASFDDDPRVLCAFSQDFPAGQDRNSIANLFRAYSYPNPGTDFIRENNWGVHQNYTAQNNAPDALEMAFVHSDNIVALMKRMHEEARASNWIGSKMGRLTITSRSRLNVQRLSFGFF